MAPLSDKTYPRGTTVYLRVYVPETEVVTNEFGEIIEQDPLEDDIDTPENDIIIPGNYQ